ncbi:DUF6933 domain-containing protein [Micromonospora sp. CA-263727]|uniref:DUF6933 domain-containing protein n=1 Tax=Micromonospora sp. CA-263727 TaxID=3239967 RepID=UPI003D927390
MLIVRATKELPQRLGSASQGSDEPSTTLLGDRCPTILPWRPRQLVLLFNEQTLLPVLMPLAAAVSASSRVGPKIAAALAAPQAPVPLVDGELSQMRDCWFAATANRRGVGLMTDFSFLADVYRRSDPDLSLLELAKRLAATPLQPALSSPRQPGQRASGVPAGGMTIQRDRSWLVGVEPGGADPTVGSLGVMPVWEHGRCVNGSLRDASAVAFQHAAISAAVRRSRAG